MRVQAARPKWTKPPAGAGSLRNPAPAEGFLSGPPDGG
jgi:hypothetical protein